MRLPLLLCCCLLLAWPAQAEDEDPGSLMAQGAALLKRGETDPRLTADAAVLFTRALVLYEQRKDSDGACDAQANLFWCQKKLGREQLALALANRGDEEAKAAAKKAEEVAATPTQPSEADAAFARAESWVKGHPEDQYRVAVRWLEVADRYAGTPASLKAQRLALDAQSRVLASVRAAASIPEVQQVAPPPQLPDAARRAMEVLNATLAAIGERLGSELESERRKASDLLQREIDGLQRLGNLEPVLGVKKQIANLDAEIQGLPQRARETMEAYRRAKQRLTEAATRRAAEEKAKVARGLEEVQKSALRKGEAAVALALRELREGLSLIASLPNQGVAGTLHVTADDEAELTLNGRKLATITLGKPLSLPLTLKAGDVISARLNNVWSEGSVAGFAAVFISQDVHLVLESGPAWRTYLPVNPTRWWEFDPASLQAAPGADGSLVEQLRQLYAKSPAADRLQPRSIWGLWDRNPTMVMVTVDEQSLRVLKAEK